MSGVSRTTATVAGVALPGVLVAVTAFLAPVPAGSGTRGPEQIRLPAQDTASLCPGPFELGAEAEGLDEEFASAGAPETRARAVTVEAGAPDGSRSTAAIRAEQLPAVAGDGAGGSADGGRTLRFETAAEPFVTGDDVVDGPALFTGLAAEEAPALTSGVQTASADSGDVAGLAAHTCDTPLTRAVFSGVSTMTGDDAQLVLGNPGDAPVSVRIALTGETGPVDIAGTDAFTIGPQQVRHIPLGALATGVPILGAEVTAEDGQVTAALQHVRRDGLTARGIEYASAQTVLDEVVAVPVATAGAVRLRVTNPGDRAVTAELSAHAADGPVELDRSSVALPAHGTAEVELGEDLPESSVRVEAEAPVTAQATVTGGDDLAHYAAAEPLGDTQLAVLPETGDGVEGSLVLSAGSGTVEIAEIGAGGSQAGTRLVDLAEDRAVVLSLAEFPEAVALELRNPAGAEVSAALGLRSEAGVSGFAVPAPPTGVDYQDVRLER